MVDAYIGLGSNVGDGLANLAAALDRIAKLPASTLVAVSHAYESQPWGTSGTEPFANAVAHIETSLEADQLLALLKEIELAMGREAGERNAPRVIDLDILLLGDEEWDSPELTIPHPRMAERDFVITPLLEVAPEITWPRGPSITREEVRVGRVTDDLGPIPGWESETVFRPAERRGPPPGAEPDFGPEDFNDAFPSADIRVPGKREEFRTRSGEEWVPLGVSQADPSPAAPELLFYEAVLKDAGIPCEFYPERPNEGFYGPYWVPRRIDLFVPAQRLAEARALIREAREAPPDWSAAGAPEE